MWKILGLVVVCGLMSPSGGKPYANRASLNEEEIARVVVSGMLQDGLLLSHLKGIAFSDVDIRGPLGGITGLRIVNLQVTGYKQPFVPAIRGAALSLSIRLDITGHTLPDHSQLVSISLEVTIRIKYGLTDFADGYYKVFFHKCGANFGAIEIALFGSAHDQEIKQEVSQGRDGKETKTDRPLMSVLHIIRKSIIADINRQICGVLNAVYDVAKASLLDTMNVPLPLGPYATLRCALAGLPSVFGTYVAVDIYIDVEVPGKGILSIPDSAGSIKVPSLNNFKYCQSFHPELFNIVLSVLAPKEPQELSCTPDKFSGADELRNAILALVPAEKHGHVFAISLYIRISVEVNPVIVFGPDGIVISAGLRVEFFLKNKDGSVYSVLIIRSDVTLSAAVSLVKGRLIFVASLSSNALVLISSDAGISDVSSLEPHCANLLGETFLPIFNGRLAVGIPVLSIYGVALINPTFLFTEGALVACI